jgi:hypothetical protein
MNFIATAFLAGSGYLLNQITPKLATNNDQEGVDRCQKQGHLPVKFVSPCSQDQKKIGNVIKPHFFKNKKADNPGYDPSLFSKDLDPDTCARIKSGVNLDPQDPLHPDLNDVGFEKYTSDDQKNFQYLPSIDDIDRDIQLIHNNMVPFFGSRVKQNVNPEQAGFQAKLEVFTGQFRDTRKNNKEEVPTLFDPSPNVGLPHGSNSVTNRDATRFHPSATGKKNNELPFEQIRVGKGVGQGYTARPSGGFHQDIRVLPKTTDERNVNPKFSYESRVIPGKSRTENTRQIGQQILKKPKAILWNWFGERNFTTGGAHKKNRQRATTVLKCTNRQDLHREHKGIAAPTHKSKSTPDSLRGKKRISHKRNFTNDYGRNLTQAQGKKHSDYGRCGFENRPTERSQTSTRVHYTNVKQQIPRNQVYLQDQAQYTRKQDLIKQKYMGKASPKAGLKGPAYDQSETAKTTIRETTEDNRRHGNMGRHQLQGPVYDQSETARTTIRETTEDNRRHGNMGRHQLQGPVYDQSETAKTTIRETTEDNRRHGNIGRHQLQGPVYDESDTARTTIRETTEDNNHHGNIGKFRHVGKVYDQSQTAKTTIRETTEDNLYVPSVNRSSLQSGSGYKVAGIQVKTPQKAYLCNNEYIGSAGPSQHKKSRVYKSTYNVNTNKEKIAQGRAPTNEKNKVNAGRETVNICVNKIDADREIPHIMGKGTSIGNGYNPDAVTRCSLTSRKNVPDTHVDRLQIETLDATRRNPLRVSQNIN